MPPITRSVGKGQSTSAEASDSTGTEVTATSGTTTGTTAATGTTGTTAATGTTGTTAATGTTGTTAATRTTAPAADREVEGNATERAAGSRTPHPTSMHRGSADMKNKRAPSSRGGGSLATQIRLAKAKEELLRLQVELAAARIATIEAEAAQEEEEEDRGEHSEDGSACTEREAVARVDTWLDNQEPPLPPPEDPQPELRNRPAVQKTEEPEARCRSQGLLEQKPTPAGGDKGPTDIMKLAEAITAAVKAGQRPKIVDLPEFSGSHQEWLPFRAAYFETASMFSNVENLNRLRRNLKSRAREAVNSLLFSITDPTEIMRTLETRFGRPESMAMAEMENLKTLPRLTESPREVCIFASRVTNAVSTLKTLNCVHYLHHPEVTKAIIEKLTPTQKSNFYRFAASQPKEDPDLLKMEKFLKTEAELCAPYALPENVHAPGPTSSSQPRRSQRVNSATEQKPYTPKCPVCEMTGHAAPDCAEYKKADIDARWDLAKARRLCFRCLRYRGKVHRCQIRKCGINNCPHLHHRTLHKGKKLPTEEKDDSEKTEAINSAWTAAKQSYLKLIPVQVSGPKGKANTYALLDDGSTVTLIDERIADNIGARGPVNPLKIEAINKMTTSEDQSRRVSITITGPNKRQHRVQARTIKRLMVSTQQVPKDCIENCKHLRDMSSILAYEEARPGILIGQDNWHLLLATKVRKGNKDQPVASLTPLGWVLHGSYTRTLGKGIQKARVHHMTDMAEEEMHHMMKEYFALESLCIAPKKPKSDPEEQALQQLQQKTKKMPEGRYETGLLWKSEDIALPDNYGDSLRRLAGIEKKLDRNPQLKEKYTEQMEALVSKGYAEPAPSTKTKDKTWYLPHFAVMNPAKPGKLRVVHDAAAKTKGVSLNDVLLKGPDLLQSLPGVIMRFREHAIAVTGDIREMFMQVKLKKEDRDALRYLWRGDRRDNEPPEEYRMTSLIFGASSSPSTAIYVKDENARRHMDKYPEAANAIIKKHYVDDYLDSFATLEDAVQVATAVKNIHQAAGFELRQWRSNSKALLQAIGESNEGTEDLQFKTEENIERVLGLIWKPTTDELTFNLNLVRVPEALISGKTPTKREALRTVMSLFDPLGFASPVTIRAKQILQEVWRRGTAWDEDLDQDLAEQWQDWIGHLKSLKEVAIPRRYLNYSDATSLQLHVFTDASESSYAAVLYWRAVLPNEEVRVSLVLAKARVTPLKLTSIPRLELQAAVLGTRMAEAVIEEHERKPITKTFWTDSRTVLTWIRTGSRSYRPYVAHRLAAIEEATAVKEWRWVPTKLNVADDATRHVPANFNSEHRWYQGPQFLYEDEDSWPIEESSSPAEGPTGEEKVNHISAERQKTQKIAEALPDASRFSSWDRLRYTTARVLLFIQLCRTRTYTVNYKRTKKNREADPDWRRVPKPAQTKKTQKIGKTEQKYVPVPAELLRRAEELLMRSTQEDSFGQEIEDIQKKKPLSKDSRLRQLSIEYTEDKLRLRSRIAAAEQLTEEFKRPMILDGGHHVVQLWIKKVHVELHHAGVEATINESRQQYWILRLRPITKTLLKRCLHCRMKTEAPPYPRTGNLPQCRVAHHKRPFTFTGVDYFGPLSVTVGRSHQKRYVAIFTCLTTRAIHLEIAATLSTDSAIMALRRLIARRGCPSEIWSDNGTNLKGADRELRQAIDEATKEEAAKKTIVWRFIPPGAPFMGGAWERMVRSVKTALTVTLHERHPNEEVLATLLAEVEFSVNSRPLTHVSTSEEDPEALTPNHFLLGSPGRVPAPGTFSEQDAASRSTWRASQRLADIFWTRWLREYLPELQYRREPHGKGHEVKIGDLVQLIDTNLPRNVWLRGKVVATYPGPDGIVRTVDVKTKTGILRRPVRKMVILPIEDVALAPEQNTTSRTAGEMCTTTSK